MAAIRHVYKFTKIVFIAFVLLGIRTFAEPTIEKQALLNFITNLSYDSSKLKWDPSISVCNWTGVKCDSTEAHICIVRLPGVRLTGQIPVNSLGQLPKLRILSLRQNRLFGSIPPDFEHLTSLTHLFLQQNQFSGLFPLSITKLPHLVRLDLSSNRFEGSIPAALNDLVMLKTLLLQNNNFSGELPKIDNIKTLVVFNVANNNLLGEIPTMYSSFSESSFEGNALLCGKPLRSCHPDSQPNVKRSSNRLPTSVIAIINTICVVSALIFICLLIYCLIRHWGLCRGTPQSPLPFSDGFSTADFSSASVKERTTTTCEQSKYNKLIFFEPEKYNFDLQSLLGASAEVLGKGSTGTSYRAEMEDGTKMIVKRLRQIIVAKKEFDTHLALLGQLQHPNVVKLIAYYYCQDEKLVITDFIPFGNLSSLLHGNKGSGGKPLDWLTRFKIGLTAARGLQYIHSTVKLPHGNVKSSNILITKSLEACLSDYNMYQLFGPLTPCRVAGYIAPELLHPGNMICFKSDVYSFGVVLLEILTGKSPNQVQVVGKDELDLPRWVESVAAEKIDADLFDKNLLGIGADEEIVAVLQVALKCVEVEVDKRPEMWEVVKMLEMVECGDYLSPASLSSNL